MRPRRPAFIALLIVALAGLTFVLGERPVEHTLRLDLGERRDRIDSIAMSCTGPQGEVVSSTWRETTFRRFIEQSWTATEGEAVCRFELKDGDSRQRFERRLQLSGGAIVLPIESEVSKLGGPR